jgi:hypothetical protein
MYRSFCLVSVCLICSSTVAQNAANYVSGSITGQTSGPAGLYVQVSGGLPTNCAGTAWGWMLIPETNKSMVSLTLLAIAQNRQVTVFTEGIPQGQAYCVVGQVQAF